MNNEVKTDSEGVQQTNPTPTPAPSPTRKKTKKKRKPRDPNKPRKPNPWLEHVRAYREKNPEMSYKQVLQEAKSTYKKVPKEVTV